MTAPGQTPDQIAAQPGLPANPVDWPRDTKLAWIRARAAAGPWQVAISDHTA